MIEPLRSAVTRVAPDVAIYDVRTLRHHLGLAASGLRLAAVCLLALGGLAGCIACIGVYGAIAALAAGRSRELGIRRALGAVPWQIHLLMAGEGLPMLGSGVGVGLGLAAMGAGSLRPFLVGVSPYDAVSFSAVPLLLGGVGLAAVAIPTWRALRLPPAEALRNL